MPILHIHTDTGAIKIIEKGIAAISVAKPIKVVIEDLFMHIL